MNLTSRHIPFAKLADLVEGRLPSEEQTAARAHVSSCPRCSSQFTELEQIISLMRDDAAESAPRDVLASALNIFRPRPASAGPSRLRRLLASLSFDSSAQLTPVYGVRSGQAATTAARQLLYTAGDNDLDLRIAQSGEGWVVSGQILGECEAGFVELSGAGSAERVLLNEQCEFTFPPVPPGTYTLRLRLTDAEVEIPGLELGT